MRKEQADVKEFMETVTAKTGSYLQFVPIHPITPPLEVRKLRVKLIAEELLEFAKAAGLILTVLPDGNIWVNEDVTASPHFTDQLDALMDLKYVVEGAVCSMGVDGEPLWDEVHRSNMTKFIDGHKREDGKWIKGTSYSPVDFMKPGLVRSIPERKVEDLNEKLNGDITKMVSQDKSPSTNTFKMAGLFILFLLGVFKVEAQVAPSSWYTNIFHFEVRTATDGINFTNIVVQNGQGLALDKENDSTNYPWANGFNHIPFGDIFFNSTGYPTNRIICYWTWDLDPFSSVNFVYDGKTYNCQTNWLQATNDPGGTLISFSPYPPAPGTNTVTHYLSFHTDGDTLSFASKPTGPWSWSGSRNYREPSYYLGSLGFVQGVSTTGAVNPVHLWLTNETWEDGVIVSKEVITQ